MLSQPPGASGKECPVWEAEPEAGGPLRSAAAKWATKVLLMVVMPSQ